LDGFKAIFSNKSSIACLIGTALGVSAWNFYLIYGASLWRQKYQLSLGILSVANIGSALCYIAGSLLAGRLVRRFGRKLFVVITALLVGLATLLVTYPQSFWYSYGLGLIASLGAGMMITGYSSLTLEQIPRFRGTMMSASSAATGLGQLICASIGGYLLMRFGYNGLGLGLGLAGILASFTFYAFTIDPIMKK
jgi:MFS family permease